MPGTSDPRYQFINNKIGTQLRPDFFTSSNAFQFPHTCRTDILSFVRCYPIGILTEHTGWRVFLQNNSILIYIDFQRVTLSDVQSSAELNG